MELTVREIDQRLLPAFACYLLPEAVALIKQERSDNLTLGAVTDNSKTCGAIAGMLVEGVLVIHSLFVDESVRHQGVATSLFHALCERFETSFTAALWDLPVGPFEEMDAFLQTLGFGPVELAEPVYRLTTDTMRRLPLIRRAFSPSFRIDANIVPVREFTLDETRDLLSDEEIDPRLMLCNFDPEDLLSDLCMGYRYAGRITAYFLVKELSLGQFSFMASVARRGANPAAYLQLVTAAVHQSLALLPENQEAEYWLEAINDTIESHVRNLAGDTAQLWCNGISLMSREHTKNQQQETVLA